MGLLGGSIIAACLICEILLRFLPLPGLEFENHTWDDLIGVGYYPYSRQIYTNSRGDYVNRQINRWGYLDKDYEAKREENVFRIGIFGDSYVEARQVPSESTFVRIIEKKLRGHNVETLGFGIMGIGTVHEYLLSRREMKRFDPDMVVYAFFENDPVDNLKTLLRSEPRYPFAFLQSDGAVAIDNSFNSYKGFRDTIAYRLYDYAMAKSLLLSTIRIRLDLLWKYPLRLSSTEEDKGKVINVGKNGTIRLPNGRRLTLSDARPSQWPVETKAYLEEVCEKLIKMWRNEVEAQSKVFAILYIPYYKEWRKPTNQQDTFKPWLKKFAEENQIEFIDPYEELLEAESTEGDILYDHLTISGHKGVSEGFAKWFTAWSETARVQS